jgi:hypothetical protein
MSAVHHPNRRACKEIPTELQQHVVVKEVICIQEYEERTRGKPSSPVSRDAYAAIFEAGDPDAWVAPARRSSNFTGVVGGTIVNNDEFPGLLGLA